MEYPEKEVDLGAVWRELKRKKRSILYWVLGGAVLGLVVAFSLPKEYQVSMVIAPEGSTTNGTSNQMGGLASMMGIGNLGVTQQGINETVYPEVVKSSPFLSEFASIAVPYKGAEITLFDYMIDHQKSAWWNVVLSLPGKALAWIGGDNKASTMASDDRLKEPSPEQIDFEQALTKRFVVNTDAKTKLITLSVTMQDPQVALLVADSMFVVLDRYMAEYHTAKERKDLLLSQEKLAGARMAFYAIDSIYARAIDQNQNLVSKSATIKIERIKNERDIAYSIYQQLATQVELNRIKLQEDTPIATVIEPARLPLIPNSPKKKLILIGFMFFAAFVRSGWLVVRYLTGSKLSTQAKV